MRRLIVLTAVALVMALAAAACGGPSSPPLGTVAGEFGYAGGPPGHPSGTYSDGTVTLTGGGHTFTVPIHTDGSFRLSVPEGTYVAEGRTRSFDSGQRPCLGPRVVVRAGLTASVRIECQLA